MCVGRRTLPTSPSQGIEYGPRANVGREGTPVFTVVKPEVFGDDSDLVAKFGFPPAMRR